MDDRSTKTNYFISLLATPYCWDPNLFETAVHGCNSGRLVWTALSCRCISFTSLLISLSIFGWSDLLQMLRKPAAFSFPTLFVITVLWLATRAGKMELRWLLGNTRCVPQEKFTRLQCNKSFNYWLSLFGQRGLMLASFFYDLFMDLNSILIHKHAKKPSCLTSHLAHNPYLLALHKLRSSRLVKLPVLQRSNQFLAE